MPNAAPLRLAVFDCDGTLVDSQHGIVAAVAAAWRGEKMEPPAAEEVRGVVGLPLEHAIALLAPGEAAPTHGRLTLGYRDAYRRLREDDDHHEPAYPGADQALDALAAAGFLLGIATGKGRAGLEMTLERQGWSDRFVTLQTSDGGPGKPNPDMLYRAMDEAGVAAADTVMIGDTSFDMIMARSAGVAAVGVSWGYHSVDELRSAGAGAIIEDYASLPGTAADLLASER